ncbi:MAG: phosphate signaling complex protein PhoU [Alphaproteobacteria bacterium]
MDKGKTDHIVSAYDQELAELSSMILRMGGLAEAQLASAIKAITTRDGELAERVVAADAKVDALEAEVDEHATRMLALRQPMAVDLRAIVAGLKLSADLERIADYAKNIAKRSLALNQNPTLPAVHAVPRIGGLAQRMISDVLDAYARRDVPMAIEVWHRDEDVDQLYNSLFRELLTYMMEDARTITSGTHLMFVAKNIERVGDLATNMAETIYFLIEGKTLEERRPKGDDTSSYAGPDQG